MSWITLCFTNGNVKQIKGENSEMCFVSQSKLMSLGIGINESMVSFLHQIQILNAGDGMIVIST